MSPVALLMLLACKSWNLEILGGLEQPFPTKAIFFFIVKAKACW
jgi:hypothetical protein